MATHLSQNPHRIFPLGDSALTIEFGREISVELNEKAVRTARYFDAHAFAGLVEIVPAYSSVTIFYDPVTIKKARPEFSTAFEAVARLAEKALSKLDDLAQINPAVIEISVDFGPENALDLEHVAAVSDLTARETIEIFTDRTYRVFMLGFLPGFAYMGEVDERIAVPRKQTPRLVVPKGSVGIANRQTGIYPFDSPGGWQIIGRTNFELFRPHADPPCALRAGDLIRFYDSTL